MLNKSILFLVNTKAGKGLTKNFDSILQSTAQSSKIAFKIVYSEYAGHLAELARDGVKDGFDKIVVAGGDGSVNEVFRELIGTNVILGILPLGSGNGLARHLQIPINLKKALQIILCGKTKLIDSATINEIPFVSIAGTGFDALIAKHFSESKSRGLWNYFKLSVKFYFSYQPIQYKISSNNKIIESDALLISFANSNQFGYNFSVAPHAKIDDGYLDICILQKPALFALPFTMFLFLFKRINKSKYYKSFKSKRLTINCQCKQMINIDGEFWEAPAQIKVKVNSKSLNIFVP